MRERITITVFGLPAPQGSKKGFVAKGRAVVVDDNKPALRTWREDVKLAALRALEDAPDWNPNASWYALHVVFTLPRPRHHYRTGKFAHLLRDKAPALHGTKPDLDKLLRSTGDALTAAGVYGDDSRVAQVFAYKTYPSVDGGWQTGLDRPGARLTITGVDQ